MLIVEIAVSTESILFSKDFFLHAGIKHLEREHFLSTKVQVLDLKREFSSLYSIFSSHMQKIGEHILL